MTSLMQDIRTHVLWYWTYHKWNGPQTIRGFELARARRDLMCLCALYRVENRRKVQP